jgi:hypothetical protein
MALQQQEGKWQFFRSLKVGQARHAPPTLGLAGLLLVKRSLGSLGWVNG